MAHEILKIKDKYFIWSSIVDAPISKGMNIVELHEWTGKEGGLTLLRELPQRLVRVEKKGTSSFIHDSLEHRIYGNHAGWNGECLTADEIYKEYT